MRGLWLCCNYHYPSSEGHRLLFQAETSIASWRIEAKAVAEGLGCRALTTSEAIGQEIADVDLVVAGAPLMGFSLPTKGMREQISRDRKAPSPADLTHPSMRDWLTGLPPGNGRFATFETRFKLSPGTATNMIEKGLQRAGYSRLAERERFLVTGAYGPLKDGELERAKAWGAQLARSME